MKNRNLNHKDDWATPNYFKDEMYSQYGLNFDPCPYNHGIEKWNGLKINWSNNFLFNISLDENNFCNFTLWKNNVQNVKNLKNLNFFTKNQKLINTNLNVNNVNLREKELIMNESNVNEFSLLNNLKSKNYYQLENKDVLDVKLSNHLIALILLMNRDANQDSDLIVENVLENMQEKKWLEKEKILMKKLKSNLQKTNIINLLEDEKGKEYLHSLIITSVEEEIQNSIGILNNRNTANYTLKINVPIVENKNFLTKIILFLYHILIVQEPLKPISYRLAKDVIEEKVINYLKIGVPNILMKEFKNILNISIKINSNTKCWINPPYNLKDKTAFVEKAVMEAKENEVFSVMLLPVSTSTKLFHKIIKPNAKSIEFVEGRIPFIGVNSKGEYVNWHLWDREAPEGVKHVKANGQHDSMLITF